MYPPQYQENVQKDVPRVRLDSFINIKHELVTLTQHINWQKLDAQLGTCDAHTDRPDDSKRFMIGLHILKHLYKLSEEEVCMKWIESPYFQYFSGETYFQHSLPYERSSMIHWRDRVGDQFLENMLQESLTVAQKIMVDATAQKKAPFAAISFCIALIFLIAACLRCITSMIKKYKNNFKTFCSYRSHVIFS